MEKLKAKRRRLLNDRRKKIIRYADILKPELEKESERVKGELDLLKLSGFNMVRLLLIWKAIEPKPSSNLEELLPEGQEYLRHMSRIIDLLYERGIYIFLDFHQDMAQEVYGGDGFPDWAISIDEDFFSQTTPNSER